MTSSNMPPKTPRTRRKSPRNPPAVSHRPADGHPLSWWRIIPPRFLGEPERLYINESLTGLAVFGADQNLTAALAGDAAAAIASALSLAPLREINLKVDIAMTALMSIALRGDPAAVLLLAHILGRGEWGNPSAEDLGLAWLDRHTSYPMSREQFAAYEVALAAAFLET
ncbi:hypothetical protein [Bradyrhizobium sp. LA2.1]|uniref:hypothetical protein n=1 Tax=Bradyrhizobium sp. LA2.1 TaxID=3156376 RepID=UPI003391CC7B